MWRLNIGIYLPQENAKITRNSPYGSEFHARNCFSIVWPNLPAENSQYFIAGAIDALLVGRTPSAPPRNKRTASHMFNALADREHHTCISVIYRNRHVYMDTRHYLTCISMIVPPCLQEPGHSGIACTPTPNSPQQAAGYLERIGPPSLAFGSRRGRRPSTNRCKQRGLIGT
ncbi:hypothetical protein PDESU_00338 [Pontiella desulfatans]|uniref:Uncharacterized protein n=1 Tax=Pontiella desulfatans TaxID=2750659 RepID=A0A6C2TW78_PONDE|nr:hypothetical protein PDESU_00338 [Pontiella desulfatans]